MESIGGIRDIVERDVGNESVVPPSAPSGLKSGPGKESRFKKTWNRRPINTTAAESKVQHANPISDSKPKSKVEQAFSKDGELSEREKIHLENIEKMSKMDVNEIEREREELLRSMDPNILQALLRRAESAEIKQPKEWVGSGKEHEHEHEHKHKHKHEHEYEYEQKQKTQDEAQKSNTKVHFDDSEIEIHDEEDEQTHSHEGIDLHFPKPPILKDTESDFLDEMHTKYFPDLEIEQDKLAWMRPVSTEEDLQEYSEYQESLAPSELRFDFAGNLITPRQSRQISTDEGLHHHGDAPLAAGYTIAELAHLARSSNYSQRCIAIRTLGRVLYRLGKLQYGKEISSGLYGLVEHARVHESLLEACDENRTRSVAVRAYATEALWLWKGGSTLRPAV